MIYLLVKLLQLVKGIVTNKALQRVFIVSLLGMIVFDSVGVFTFGELWDVLLQIYISTLKGIVDGIISGIKSSIEWVNNQIINYIKNQVGL